MNKLKEAIQALSEQFRKISKIEEEIMEAVAANKLSQVEQGIIREQSAVMKLRGLERIKDQALDECGYEGFSFTQILEKMDVSSRKEFIPIFEELSTEIQIFSRIHEDTGTLLQVKLRHLNNMTTNQINHKA
ncbi:hypothetical protein M2145_000429 [Lachnospiraceae bacterium PF1-21]|uniref:DUF2383 domain-containing protein n=1 Tax=Ohessyouella blattaphilus TaxID=2949333 RepID=A0ABT1EET3_9FIRM|nr:hypothetical protein [Ohessyouella blattaphilus]MCP1109153.1 hypothetical protein [Ohessyouella blattaphilus]MCR8562547.1 hypothetical protein [Ohessyouella blattaphilus]MDL2250255.1 hypothetical protein [Lachnospiraceae bacterium OttesenSCG-928-J05]